MVQRETDIGSRSSTYRFRDRASSFVWTKKRSAIVSWWLLDLIARSTLSMNESVDSSDLWWWSGGAFVSNDRSSDDWQRVLIDIRKEWSVSRLLDFEWVLRHLCWKYNAKEYRDMTWDCYSSGIIYQTYKFFDCTYRYIEIWRLRRNYVGSEFLRTSIFRNLVNLY